MTRTPDRPRTASSSTLSLAPLASALALLLALGGCMAEIGEPDPEPGAPPEYGASSVQRFATGSTVEVCRFPAGLPLRHGPDPSEAVIRQMPEGTRGTVRDRFYSWYELQVASQRGWAYGTALCAVASPSPSPSPAPGAPAASVRFLSPAAGATVDNGFVIKVATTGDVRRVEYWADDKYRFAQSSDRQRAFEVKATFHTLGRRVVSARAFDAAGAALARTSIAITVRDASSGSPSSAALADRLPYFYQYANALYPGSSCQNTSTAMVLALYGWKGRPDDITRRFGKHQAQSPAGLASVFNTLAAEAGLSRRLRAHTDGTVSAVRALLKAGKPVIVHGYFTGSGHVIVLSGFDGAAYTANDPAGRWNQAFKGGYPGAQGSTSGRKVRYGAAALETAILSTNGSNSVPIWYHEVL